MEQSDAIQALGALAQEHRLSVFRLLVRAGNDGVAAGDIARQIGVAPAALSFHLKELDHAKLIHAKRDGRFIRYSANFDCMQALLTFLTEDCCAGHPDGCDVSPLAGQLTCEDASSPPRKRKPKPSPRRKIKETSNAG
ncbi:MAG: metalloregulator ArsR/SmtB family transcription factor [Pseudomonadota bacterium]